MVSDLPGRRLLGTVWPVTSDVDVEEGDEERWAEAEAILAGKPSADAQRRGRRLRNRLLLSLVGLVVVALALGLLLALLFPGHHHQHRSSGSTGWLAVTGLVVTGCGLLVEIVALVKMARSRQWGAAWRSPLMALTRRQRRSLAQQVRGKRPVDPARLALTRYTAERWEGQSPLIFLVFVGAGLIGAGNVLITPNAYHYGLAGYWVVLVVLMFVVWGRQRRQARRFLQEHPAPVD